jgi:predicted deacetylase
MLPDPIIMKFCRIVVCTRVSHQKRQVRLSWGLSAIAKLQNLTKLYTEKKVHLSVVHEKKAEILSNTNWYRKQFDFTF